ncbi:LysR family transcriptional regulator [Devosia sp. SD17-2]|uniref:LysR family transcriptional regulator n=1 Tax=Devosia sp. SD17-2 TaxID=2976459 RepID=UPI0023D7EB13|nr:LysR family transcriptional regulator [Devosia sp. SD17-2]WEJ32828.1 LysR family transcriptional regulator [Devosia sp. SD17-2]
MADLDALRTFIAAARLGSFAGAARQLNLSPAMVGRRIQGLEERYGLKLIERTTRSQHLTEQGGLFLARAEAVLDAAEALAECSSDTGALTGRIRLSAPTTLGIARLPAIVARFSAEHPGVVVEMSLANRRVDLVGEGYDLAVRVGELATSSLVARRIGTYRFVCCVVPDFLARHGPLTHPTQLAQARCVLNLNFAQRNHWQFIGNDEHVLTVEVGGGIETDNDEAQRLLARDGAGIAYLPRDIVVDDLAAGSLVPLFEDWSLPSMPIHTVHASRSLAPRRVRLLTEALSVGFRGT